MRLQSSNHRSSIFLKRHVDYTPGRCPARQLVFLHYRQSWPLSLPRTTLNSHKCSCILNSLVWHNRSISCTSLFIDAQSQSHSDWGLPRHNWSIILIEIMCMMIDTQVLFLKDISGLGESICKNYWKFSRRVSRERMRRCRKKTRTLKMLTLFKQCRDGPLFLKDLKRTVELVHLHQSVWRVSRDCYISLYHLSFNSYATVYLAPSFFSFLYWTGCWSEWVFHSSHPDYCWCAALWNFRMCSESIAYYKKRWIHINLQVQPVISSKMSSHSVNASVATFSCLSGVLIVSKGDDSNSIVVESDWRSRVIKFKTWIGYLAGLFLPHPWQLYSCLPDHNICASWDILNLSTITALDTSVIHSVYSLNLHAQGTHGLCQAWPRMEGQEQLRWKRSGVCMAASILGMQYCGNESKSNKRSTESSIRTSTIIKVARS
jgi:hypothetical protein